MFENGRMHVHVVADLGFPFIINKGMLSKNSIDCVDYSSKTAPSHRNLFKVGVDMHDT